MTGPVLPPLHMPSGHKQRQLHLLWPVIGTVLKRYIYIFHKIKVDCVKYAFCTDSPVTTTRQNVCHKLCHCTFHSLSVILYTNTVSNISTNSAPQTRPPRFACEVLFYGVFINYIRAYTF